MDEYWYCVEKQNNTTFIRKIIPIAPMETLHLADDTVTFVCTNFYDAIEIAETFVGGGLSAAEEEYKGQILFVESIEGVTIHVNRTQIKCPETRYPCCSEGDIDFLR